MQEENILIIGSGLAGLTAALTAADAGMKVSLITLDVDSDSCNSGRAQGGIIYHGGENDSPELLEKDIYNAGCQHGYLPAIRHLAEQGPKAVKDILLDRLNIPFDKNAKGKLHLTSEGAHSTPRIIHVRDTTGKEIYDPLLKAVKNHPNVSFRDQVMAIDLLTTDHSSKSPEDAYCPQRCFGVYAFDLTSKKVITIRAKHTIIATGGLGGLFSHTTNPDAAGGAGIAIARRAGARLLNMEFVQFHPTGLYHPQKPRFLLSEALRGEGGILINHEGNEFMQEYHPMKNLAPRDVVARAIYDQMLKYRKKYIFLDISHKDSSWIKKRFPLLTAKCEEYGYAIDKEPVPVVPVAHYSCGGILTDLKGNTSIKSLKAIGEVACTGVHGANRLASTSLMECVLWGYNAAKDIENCQDQENYLPEAPPWKYEHEAQDLSLIYQDWDTLRSTMWNYLGPLRSQKRLSRARTILTNLKTEVDNFYAKAELSTELISLRNGVDAALALLHAALKNKKSIGCHYLEDQ